MTIIEKQYYFHKNNSVGMVTIKENAFFLELQRLIKAIDYVDNEIYLSINHFVIIVTSKNKSATC